MGRSHELDIGTDIILNTGVDVSGASVARIHYMKPDRSVGFWSADILDTTKLKYTTVEGDLDQVGEWLFQSYIESGIWIGFGEVARETIYSIIPEGYLVPKFQGFLAYTKVDTELRLTVQSNHHIEFAILEANDVSYLQYDYEAGAFEDFIHRFKIEIDASLGQPFMIAWGMSEGLFFTDDDKDTNLDGLSFIVEYDGADYILKIKDHTNTNEDTSVYTSFPSERWVEIERSGTTLTAKIYADEFAIVEDELSIVCTENAMRYHSGIASAGSGAADDNYITGRIRWKTA